MRNIRIMGLKNVIIMLLIVFVSISCAEQPGLGDQPNDVDIENTSSVDDKVNSLNESANIDVESTNSGNNGANSQSSMETIYFAFDKFDLNANNVNIATTNAEQLSNNDKHIKLEGNCDEWGSDEYNYALGLKRAKSVKNSLVANGVSEDRISIVSYGESNAICNERNKACWSKNRRVETTFLP